MRLLYIALSSLFVISCQTVSENKYEVTEISSDLLTSEQVFYPSGALKEVVEYTKSENEFKYKTYYENGKLKSESEQGSFNGCGIQVGTELNYDSTGVLIKKREFDNFASNEEASCHETRSVISVTDYYPNGNTRKISQIETCYECDQCPCGELKVFNETGELIESNIFESCYDCELNFLEEYAYEKTNILF